MNERPQEAEDLVPTMGRIEYELHMRKQSAKRGKVEELNISIQVLLTLPVAYPISFFHVFLCNRIFHFHLDHGCLELKTHFLASLAASGSVNSGQ